MKLFVCALPEALLVAVSGERRRYAVSCFAASRPLGCKLPEQLMVVAARRSATPAPNVPPSPAPPKLTVVELAVGGVRAPVHVNLRRDRHWYNRAVVFRGRSHAGHADRRGAPLTCWFGLSVPLLPPWLLSPSRLP